MGTLREKNSDANWVSLTDYSFQTGISLSTLRRRIKKNEIAFKLENGKYFLSLGAPQEEPKDTPARNNVEEALNLIADAFEFNLKEKDKEISSLKKEKKQLEERVKELSSLVEILERKFSVQY